MEDGVLDVIFPKQKRRDDAVTRIPVTDQDEDKTIIAGNVSMNGDEKVDAAWRETD